MKLSTLKILLLQVSIAIFLILDCFVFHIFSIKEYDYFTILLINLLLSIFLLGYAKNKYFNKKQVTIAVLVFSLTYQSILFVLLGIKFGFLKNVYNFNGEFIIKIILPQILIIITKEMLRHQMINKGRFSKLVIISTVLLMTIMDSLFSINLYNLSTLEGHFNFVFFVIIVALFKNIYMTYMCYHYGYTPNIIFALLIEMTSDLLPIIPDVSPYLNSIISIILPFLLLIFFIELTKKKDEIEIAKKHIILRNGIVGFFLILDICFFLMMFGMFNHYFLVIGSGSMEKTLYVGDIVYVKKTTKFDELVEGEIIVFKKDKKTVVHRISSISEDDNIYSIITKGDNNKEIDDWIVSNEDIIGVAKAKIPYIGLPSIWLKELVGGK